MCVVAEKLENRGIQKGIRGTIEICQEFGIAREQIINKVMEKYSLTREETEQEMDRCWRQKTE